MTPSWLKQIEIIHKSWQREKTINWILKTVLNWILEPYWHSQQKLSRRLFFSMGYQLDQVWSSFILLQYWWECKLVQPLWKTVWRFLKKLRIELLYDPAILLLDIYLEKVKLLIQKDTFAILSNCLHCLQYNLFISRWMDKEDAMWPNVDGLREYYA